MGTEGEGKVEVIEGKEGKGGEVKVKMKLVEKNRRKRIGIKDYLTTFLLLYNCAIFRLLTELPPFECL